MAGTRAAHCSPSLGTLILARDTERVAAARRIRDPATGPINSGTDDGSILGVGRGGGGGGTPGQHRIPANREPNTNPRPI